MFLIHPISGRSQAPCRRLFPRVRSEETGHGTGRPRAPRLGAGADATRQRREPKARSEAGMRKAGPAWFRPRSTRGDGRWSRSGVLLQYDFPIPDLHFRNRSAGVTAESIRSGARVYSRNAISCAASCERSLQSISPHSCSARSCSVTAATRHSMRSNDFSGVADRFRREIGLGSPMLSRHH